MHDARLSVAVLFSSLILFSSIPSLAELPPLYQGELNVCHRVNQERAKGRSLEQAVQTVIRSVQPDETVSLESLQRTVIHHAIKTCNFDPSAVVTAAYQAGVPLPLVVGAAEAAGAGHDVITAALVQAGVTPSAVRSAFVQAQTFAEPSVSLSPPSAFDVGIGGGLGQASPFSP
ncbi:MAG TPA: hypothetical protein VFH55_05615 [Nitrospiria bacterium]|nr:hypothetical protein [Nitrospiria bacterium]